jgi:phage FluMu gp28-like protein
LIKRNVEQFSHAGATPFGYTELGKDLGHTGNSHMAQDIYDGTLEHDALIDGAINAIVAQLRKHPAIDKILKPVVTPEDFKSAFKCVPEKTTSSFLVRGVHHYKACAEVSDDGLADIQVEVHAEIMASVKNAGNKQLM